MFLWVGQQAQPNMLQSLFNVSDVNRLDPSLPLPIASNEHSVQVHEIISKLRLLRSRWMEVVIVREGHDLSNNLRFSNLMLEDANFENLSYVDYLCNIHRAIQDKTMHKG